MRAQREEPQAPAAFSCKDVERTGTGPVSAYCTLLNSLCSSNFVQNSRGGSDQWETPVGKIFHADLDTSLGASLEPPASEIAKQIRPVQLSSDVHNVEC